MRIIQAYKTDGDYVRSKAGFQTLSDFKTYLAASYIKHKSIASSYKIYTDEYGEDIISSIIEGNDIEIVEFPKVSNNRYIYEGKMLAHSLQEDPYILVDLDATLFDIPNTNKDVISEGFQHAGGYYLTHDKLNINVRKLPKRYWSGLLGFNNIEFKNLYISEVELRYPLLDYFDEITKDVCIHLEEVLLSRLIKDDNAIKVHTLNKQSFEHLRDSKK